MMSFSVAVASLLGLCVCLLLISPAVSLTCTSQTLKSNHKFDQCLDLPTLDSYLHYSYNATNSSLSIAFVAPPAKPEGWVAWAINPTGQGMAGAQALLAFKSNSKVVVKTFDVSSFSSITESKLSFETWDLSAEATSNGNLVIYGSMKVAEKADKLNLVWQVGGQVTDNKPQMHDFQPKNLKAKDTLVLEKVTSSPTSPSPSTAQAPEEGGQSPIKSTPEEGGQSPIKSTPEKGGQSLIKSNHLALFFGLLLFIAAVFHS
ncbi:hypothetical protein EZV62_001248 [Acer yangbiense]|uniref:DOMON domain-containing protein n=1 Tax=Acer yangbiense TaxID=1000413 RepID=A0A5C7IUE0_9ROSI|nr:hypothetical protein EZV62_001248 [Acer yangbiense]